MRQYTAWVLEGVEDGATYWIRFSGGDANHTRRVAEATRFVRRADAREVQSYIGWDTTGYRPVEKQFG